MSHISRSHLAEVIAKRTLTEKDTTKLAQEVAAFLLDEGITGQLDSLIRDIMQYRLDHGALEARIISAHELSQPVLNDVTELLRKDYPNARNFELDTELDPKVVGGMRIDLPNEQLDLTVKAKLDTFKRLTAGGA